MAYDKVANGLNYCKSKLPFLGKIPLLRSDKTYIIPSGFGFAFGLLVMVLLVLAINSANNLIYFFAFFLVSIALTGMLVTNQNIEAVKVTGIQESLVFAKEKNQLAVNIKNKEARKDIWNLEIQLDPENKSIYEQSTVASIQVFQEQIVSVNWTPTMRGLQKIPRLKIQSYFPFGMLKAWKYFEQNTAVVVFPERKGKLELPLEMDLANLEEARLQADTKDSFRDFRDYQKTDNPNRIDWKRSLKHQKHLVKNYESEGQKRIIVDWQLIAVSNDFEDHISQLALWIDQCHKKNVLYSLRIFNYRSDFDAGLIHYRQCLQKLAFLTPQDLV